MDVPCGIEIDQTETINWLDKSRATIETFQLFWEFIWAVICDSEISGRICKVQRMLNCSKLQSHEMNAHSRAHKSINFEHFLLFVHVKIMKKTTSNAHLNFTDWKNVDSVWHVQKCDVPIDARVQEEHTQNHIRISLLCYLIYCDDLFFWYRDKNL